jgi:hypothetical protein
VHFSSAGERVKNFKYKLQLIEQYDSRLGVLNSSTGSLGENVNVTTKKRNEVISGFDDFENYLYFQSGSLKYTYGSCSIDPWPKTDYSRLTPSTWQEAVTKWNQINTAWSQGGSLQTGLPPEKPYTLYHTTSSVADTYYKNLIATASLFDRDNDNRLVKTIPAHIRNDSSNDQYELFVNMMGHHFDILWTYVKHLNKIITREEHPHDGMSNDLLFNVAKSMGWNLTIGDNTTDLWKYTLGINQDGTAQSTGSLSSESQENVTKEIWRRIVNNLPYMLKTKGTARSVKALLSCYGIPQTMLAIREYGGPKLPIGTKKPVFVKDDFSYALRANNGQYIRSAWLPVKTGSYKVPDTLELRFRTKDGLKESVNGVTIFQAGFGPRPEWYVTAVPSGSNKQKGNLNFYLSGSGGYKSASINDEYLFDGNWAGLMVRRDTGTDITGSDNSYTMFIKKHKYDKLTTDVTASISITGATEYSYNHSWKRPDLHGTETIPKIHYGWGDNPAGVSHFSGSYQEIRYWSRPLDEEDFANHVTSPSTYDGNNITSSFEQLKFRIPLRQKFDIAMTSSLKSQHPDQSITEFTSSWITSASFHNFSGSTDFYGIDETYYIENPSIGGNNLWSDKIRIESSTLTGVLNTKTRKEKSTYDTSPVDSPRLGIYFSPQNSINEDIFNQLGFWEVDDYIGAPDNVYKDSYPGLKALAWDYWKKYDDRNNYNDYLRMIYQYDMSLFKQIEQLLPARAKKLDGVLIEPNILERSKDVVLRKSSWMTPYYTMSYDTSQTEFSLSSSYSLYTGSLSLLENKNISSSYDNLPGLLIPLGLSVEASRYKFNELITVDELYDTGIMYPSSVYEAKLTASFASGDKQPSKNAWGNIEDITGSRQPISWGDTAHYNTLDEVNPTGSLGGQTAVITPMLSVSEYGFNIPRGATIKGIQAYISRTQVVTGSMQSYDTGFCKDFGVWLDVNVSSSNIVNENKASTREWPESSYNGGIIAYNGVTASYGNDGHTWGRNWTPDLINTGSFGLKFIVQGRAGIAPYYSRLALVESVGLKVFYTLRSVVTASNPYWQYDPMQPVITGSRRSTDSYIKLPGDKYYDTGWNAAGTASISQSSAEGISWGSVGSVTGGADNIFASSSVSMSFNAGLQASQSYMIVSSDFRHSIPDGVTVTGIMARIKRKASNAEPDPDNLPGGRGYYIGVSDYIVKVNDTTGSDSKWSAVGNKANIAVYSPGSPFGASITTNYPSTASNALQGLVSESTSLSLHNFTDSKYSWSFQSELSIEEGASPIPHTCSLYNNTSGNAGGYVQYALVDRNNFDHNTNGRFNITTPFVVRDLGFQIGSAGASPAYSDSGSWVVDGIKIDVHRGAYDNSGGWGTPYNSAVYDSYITDPGSSALGGVFPFTGSGAQPYPQQALGWGLAQGNRQRYTDAWSTVSRTTHWTGPTTYYYNWSGFETKTYPTESSKQTSWDWGHDWTGNEVNSSSFAIGIGPAYKYMYELGLPNNYTCSALIDTISVTVYAYSSSINPSSPEVSGSITNTWLTQSQYATFGAYNDTWGTVWNRQDVTGSNFSLQYQINFPTGSVNTGSIDSVETRVFYKTTASVELSTIHEFLPRGIENHRYAGCKVTSADWNVDSPDTVDGGPVVEIKKSNPNKFIVSSGGVSGSIQVL